MERYWPPPTPPTPTHRLPTPRQQHQASCQPAKSNKTCTSGNSAGLKQPQKQKHEKHANFQNEKYQSKHEQQCFVIIQTQAQAGAGTWIEMYMYTLTHEVSF
jgi:hypothetical protein